MRGEERSEKKKGVKDDMVNKKSLNERGCRGKDGIRGISKGIRVSFSKFSTDLISFR